MEGFPQDELVTNSSAAGKTVGRLMYYNNRGWTEEMITHWANKLRPNAPMLISVYKRAVVEGFMLERERARDGFASGGVGFPPGFHDGMSSGNLLPPSTKDDENDG